MYFAFDQQYDNHNTLGQVFIMSTINCEFCDLGQNRNT